MLCKCLSADVAVACEWSDSNGMRKCVTRCLSVLGVMMICGMELAYSQSAALISPEPGASLTASTVTFTWEDRGAHDYLLRIGTSSGATDLLSKNVGGVTSYTVDELPLDREVFVALWTRVSESSPSYWVYSATYNLDIDGDGISNSLDTNPTEPEEMMKFTGEDYTLTLLGSGRVASLQLSSAEVTDFANTNVSTDAMRGVMQKVYNHLTDDFDFSFIVSNQDSAPAGAAYSGRHWLVRNDVGGLGLALFDGSDSYGSDGRLQSAIHLTTRGAIRGGPSLHEMAHRWANHLASVPTEVSSHWGYCSAGGQLGGWADDTLVDLGGGNYSANSGREGATSFGSFANGGNSVPFSDLELYLMGLVSADGLPDIKIAQNYVATGAGTFSASGFTTVSMDDIVRIDGARTPGIAESQKEFNGIVVVITDEALTSERWAAFDEDAYWFSLAGDDGVSSRYNFYEATEGRASLQLDGLLAAAGASSALALPVLIIKEMRGDGIARMEFTSESGRIYQLQRSLDLHVWGTILADIPGIDGVTEISDPTAVDLDYAFYRILVE